MSIQGAFEELISQINKDLLKRAPKNHTHFSEDIIGIKITNNFVQGTYVGTGTTGKDNAIKLTFNRTPALLIVVAQNSSSGFITMKEQTIGFEGFDINAGSETKCHITWSDKDVSWYTTSIYSNKMMNSKDVIYYYTCFFDSNNEEEER